MHRRQFLIVSSMGAAVAAATRTGLAGAAVESHPPIPVQAVLYEPRYLIARQFANRHAASGIRLFGTNECMVRLWRGDLAKSVDRGSARIAGLTLYSDFAMARDCARDQGLKVLHEEWCREAPRTLVSWLMGVA